MQNKSKIRLKKLVSSLIGLLGVAVGQAHAQQVALLDSGVDPTRGFNISGGFNYYNNTDDTSDVSDREGEGHGTVSVRVASEAFTGEIVPFVITDGDLDRMNESQVQIARDAALSDILGRDSVRVVGITWGTSGVVGSSAALVSDLSRANKVIAIMAGNDVAAQPNALSTSSFNLAGVVIVGGTDADGVLLPESNHAGTTANKYVAVNGLPEEGATGGGSSWATARLSGIAGAVLLQNPDLTAEEVVEVILQSAEDRGEVGTDNVYGRGVILSAQQVLDNVIGPVVVPTTPVTPVTPPSSGGGGGGGGGAVLLLGGALAGALLLARKPSQKLEKTLVLDSYGRSFEIDLNQHIEVNDGRLHLNEFFHSLQQQSLNHSVASQIQLPRLRTQVAFQASALSDPRIDFIEYFAAPGDVGIESKNKSVSLALASQLIDSVGFTAGYRVSPHQEFGGVRNLEANGHFGASSFLSGQSFGSVLSGFSSQANTSSLTYKRTPGSKAAVKLGLVSVDQTERFNQTSLSTLLEGSYELTDNAGISLQFGQIEENGSVLGGGGGGVFGVEGSTTYALNLAGNLNVTNKFSVVGNYGIGRTSVESSTQSLLKDFSTLRSDWYSLGLIGNNVLRAKDQVGFAFSQPLKVQSGAVDYSIPVSRLGNGDIGFDSERVNLSDTNATEQTFEAYYRTMLNDKFEIGGFMSYRKNPNHISDQGHEGVIMATIRFWQ